MRTDATARATLASASPGGYGPTQTTLVQAMQDGTLERRQFLKSARRAVPEGPVAWDELTTSDTEMPIDRSLSKIVRTT